MPMYIFMHMCMYRVWQRLPVLGGNDCTLDEEGDPVGAILFSCRSGSIFATAFSTKSTQLTSRICV